MTVKDHLIVGAFFLAWGGFFAAFAVPAAMQRRRLARFGRSALATIVGFQTLTDVDGVGSTTHALLEFVDVAGRPQRGLLPSGTRGLPLPIVGTRVEVLYDPENPAILTERTGAGIWLTPILLALAASGGLLASLYNFWRALVR